MFAMVLVSREGRNDVVGKLAQLNTLSLSYKCNVVSFRTTRSSDVVRLSVMVVGNWNILRVAVYV